jgi:hypothetical protein
MENSKCPRCEANDFNGEFCTQCKTDHTTPYAIRMNKAIKRREEHHIHDGSLFGVVVLYDIWKNTRTGEKKIEEITRSVKVPYMVALNAYAETPNPASQLLVFRDDKEYEEVSAELNENIKDPQWLQDLFDCI